MQPRARFAAWIKNEAALDIVHSDSWQILPNTAFVFYEAQLSYVDKEFWAVYLKPVATSPHEYSPHVIRFLSYDSPGMFAWRSVPVPLKPKQRVSVRPLATNNNRATPYFYRDEFEDAVERFSRLKTNEYELYSLNPDLHWYLYDFTSGHPAVVQMTIELLGDSKVGSHMFRLFDFCCFYDLSSRHKLREDNYVCSANVYGASPSFAPVAVVH
jgi:hypothetical protein